MSRLGISFVNRSRNVASLDQFDPEAQDVLQLQDIGVGGYVDLRFPTLIMDLHASGIEESEHIWGLLRICLLQFAIATTNASTKRSAMRPWRISASPGTTFSSLEESDSNVALRRQERHIIPHECGFKVSLNKARIQSS